MQCSKPQCYSITSSAVASSLSGTVRPSIRAVGTLMTSHSRQVAAGPGKARNKAKPDRVYADKEDDGDRRSCALAASAEGIPPIAAITATRRCTNSAANSGSRSG